MFSDTSIEPGDVGDGSVSSMRPALVDELGDVGIRLTFGTPDSAPDGVFDVEDVVPDMGVV